MTRRTRMLEELAIGAQWLRRQSGEQLALDDTVMPPVASPAASPQPDTASTDTDSDNVIDTAPSNAGDADTVPGNAIAGKPEIAMPGRHSDAEIAEMDWTALQAAVSTCTRCRLCESRTRTVFGTGDPKAKWLFVGEGPGRNEDQQGEPFIGPAGKLLDNMLLAISLRRGNNTFIANVVKCRPIDATGRDRAPTSEEAAACKPYLDRQIALIQPSVLVALGKSAAIVLLAREPSTAVSALRGVVHRYGDVPLVVTYHPAYLLRALVDKRKSWEDLCLAMDVYAGTD